MKAALKTPISPENTTNAVRWRKLDGGIEITLNDRKVCFYANAEQQIVDVPARIREIAARHEASVEEICECGHSFAQHLAPMMVGIYTFRGFYACEADDCDCAGEIQGMPESIRFRDEI